MAVIVKSYAGNEGKIVRCVRFIGVVYWKATGPVDAWELDVMLPSMEGPLANKIADMWLRPIRDADGEDETLTWKCGKAPKVEPVTQPETMSWWPT